MDIPRALAQIEQIHEQLAKGEVYRGYRSLPLAASGVIGIVAAWFQPRAVPEHDPVGFVVYWVAIAVVAGFLGVSEIVYNYVVHDDARARRRTRLVVGQFLPSLLGGAIVTASFVHLSAALVPLLPGLWAICFGIGTFASRPYLPAPAATWRCSTMRPAWCSCGSRAGRNRSRAGGSAARSARARCSPRSCCTGTSSGPTAELRRTKPVTHFEWATC